MLTDETMSVLMMSCSMLREAVLAGLKRITSKAFVPIIAGLNAWRDRRSAIRLRLLKKRFEGVVMTTRNVIAQEVFYHLYFLVFYFEMTLNIHFFCRWPWIYDRSTYFASLGPCDKSKWPFGAAGLLNGSIGPNLLNWCKKVDMSLFDLFLSTERILGYISVNLPLIFSEIENILKATAHVLIQLI